MAARGAHPQPPSHTGLFERTFESGKTYADPFNDIDVDANDYDTDDVTTRNDFGPYVGQGPITEVRIGQGLRPMKARVPSPEAAQRSPDFSGSIRLHCSSKPTRLMVMLQVSTVVFNKQIRGPTSADGAKVAINRRDVAILEAILQPDGATVRYKLASPIQPNDRGTWAYNASKGEVQNLDGSFLQSVSERKILH